MCFAAGVRRRNLIRIAGGPACRHESASAKAHKGISNTIISSKPVRSLFIVPHTLLPKSIYQ